MGAIRLTKGISNRTLLSTDQRNLQSNSSLAGERGWKLGLGFWETKRDEIGGRVKMKGI